MTETQTAPTLEHRYGGVVHTTVELEGIGTAEVWSFGLDHAAIRVDTAINGVDYELNEHLYGHDRLYEINYHGAYRRGLGNRERHESAERDAAHSIIPVTDGWVRDRPSYLGGPLRRKGVSLDKGTDAANRRAYEHHLPLFANWLNGPEGTALRVAAETHQVTFLIREADERLTMLDTERKRLSDARANLLKGIRPTYADEIRITSLKVDDPNDR